MEIFRDFTFEAAHSLPEVPAGHKCARMHGHSYQVTVTLTGPVHPVLGWVMEFGEMKVAVASVLQRLDHRCLNDIYGLSNPTVENLAVWIWKHLAVDLPLLSAITTRETATAGCTYRGSA